MMKNGNSFILREKPFIDLILRINIKTLRGINGMLLIGQKETYLFKRKKHLEGHASKRLMNWQKQMPQQLKN